jgi:hypothetical protein
MSDPIHDLTVLYLKNSVKLSELTSPEEYVRVYLESYYRIKTEISQTKAKVKDEHMKKITEKNQSNVGWI